MAKPTESWRDIVNLLVEGMIAGKFQISTDRDADGQVTAVHFTKAGLEPIDPRRVQPGRWRKARPL